MYLALLGIAFVFSGLFLDEVACFCIPNLSTLDVKVFAVLGIVILILGVILIIASFVNTGNEIGLQLKGQTELDRLTEAENIYAKKAKALIKQFSSYLAELYPEHEKNIFQSIAPGKLDIYIAKYPELKSSDTITRLVGHISRLESDKYSQQLEKARVAQKMTFRQINPWLWSFLIPKFEKEDVQISSETE